jgi:hypothetical protein
MAHPWIVVYGKKKKKKMKMPQVESSAPGGR